jgi:serine/threonine-protein kinase
VLIAIDDPGTGTPSLSSMELARILQAVSSLGAAAVGIVQPVDGVDSSNAELSAAAREAGTVVIPVFVTAQDNRAFRYAPGFSPLMQANSIPRDRPRMDLKARLRHLDNPFDPILERPPFGQRITEPSRAVAEQAAGLGYLGVVPDRDGVLRRHRLLQPVDDWLIPSLELQLAALWLGVDLRELSISRLGPERPGITLGSHRVPTDSRYRALIDFNEELTSYTWAELDAGKLPPDALLGKVVLVGGGASPGLPAIASSLGGPLSPLQTAGHTVATLLGDSRLQRPHWGWAVEAAVLLLSGLLLTLFTPRVGIGSGAIFLTLFVAAWWGGTTLLFLEQGIYLKVLSPVALAVIGFPVQILWRGSVAAASQTETAELNRSLGITLHGQGMLDLAFERLAKCPLRDEAARDALYNLGLDFERKRMPHKAAQLYRLLSTAGRYRDVLGRLAQVEAVADPVRLSEVGRGKGGTLVLDSTEVCQTVGRYEIIGELGRGAMSTVYRGRDPKINREVAIKTLGFGELDESLVAQVKSRFLREAEAAGKLNHPNIVTIYDVGEDHDLAYLAMELLGGEDLSEYCREGQLLLLDKVLGIVGEVAEALQYAHGNGIVHRDIKPANIRVVEDDTIKVTDFGIARIMDSSHTRTGAILGTPYYMSPEQVAGKRVDGRSDLFSLGVVFYELLTGQHPFTGENPAALMYNITKSAHVPIRERLPNLPVCCGEVVEKLLTKPVSRRFKTATEVVAAVRGCREQIA